MPTYICFWFAVYIQLCYIKKNPINFLRCYKGNKLVLIINVLYAYLSHEFARTPFVYFQFNFMKKQFNLLATVAKKPSEPCMFLNISLVLLDWSMELNWYACCSLILRTLYRKQRRRWNLKAIPQVYKSFNAESLSCYKPILKVLLNICYSKYTIHSIFFE